MKFGESRTVNLHDSFIDWLSNSFDNWETQKRQLGAMLCWSIWKYMNEMVWNQQGMKIKDVVVSANVILSQWYSAHDKSFNYYLGFMTQEDGDKDWVRPTGNKIKVNTYAAIFATFGCYSYAFAVRYYEGMLIEARSRCCPGNISLESTEAMGIRETLSQIKEKDQEDVVVETYYPVVIQAIRGTPILLSYFCKMIEDCKVLLAELKGKYVLVKFVKRFANHVAHFIAIQQFYS